MTSTAVFFLHGSGDTGPNLRLYMDSLPIETFDFKTFTQVSQENGITVYTPSSGTRKYTPAFGSSMNVWFDRSADFNCLGLEDTYEDQEGISKSLDMLLHEVEKVQHNYDHVFIGGESNTITCFCTPSLLLYFFTSLLTFIHSFIHSFFLSLF